MLSRTADNLYWLARYVERAEYIARILDTTLRLTALPLAYVGSTNEWESAVATAGCAAAFSEHYKEANEETVTEFLAFSTSNPSSIRNCFESRAAQCARGAHRADHRNVGRHQRRLARTEALGQRAALARGIRPLSALGARIVAALRRLGLPHHAAQRRLLVLAARRLYGTRRQHRAHPRREISPAAARLEKVGGPLDYYQWTSILRSVSALTAYHWVYRENVKPWLVADLLMLRDEMPRSLASCYENLVQNLDRIANAYGRQGPAQRQARTVRARLENSKIDQIFQNGLHEFIDAFVEDNNRLGTAVSQQYLL